MKKKFFLMLIVFIVSCQSFTFAAQVDESNEAINKIFSTVQERKNKIIKDNTTEIFPPTGYAALYVKLLENKDNAAVNKEIIEYAAKPIADYSFFGTQGLARLYYTFCQSSPLYPKRLTLEAENALKKVMFDFLKGGDVGLTGDVYSKVEKALWDFENIIIYHGSENHDIGSYGYYYLYSQALKDDEAYKNSKLSDGKTVIEHYNAWQKWVDKYFVERVKKGMLGEVNSPIYFKYTIAHVFDLRDFSQSAYTKQRAEKFLDVLFAIIVNESVGGQIGGSRTRSYQDFYSSTQNETDKYHWAYFGTYDDYYKKENLSLNGIALFPLLSDYVPPYELFDLAVNQEKRGNYMYKAMPIGRAGKVPGKTIPQGENVLTFPTYALRTTYVTPNYMLGAMAVDPTLTYSGINQQNRWMGVTFVNAENKPARIFFQDKGRAQDGRTSYSDSSGVVSNSSMLVQRLPNATDADNFRTFFSAETYETIEQQAGWIFAYDPNGSGYIGIKPSKGEFSYWEEAAANYKSPMAKFVNYTVQNIPIVVQCGDASEYVTFENFINKTLQNKFEWVSDNEFVYEGPDSGVMKWSSAKGGTFFIDGQSLDLNTKKVYDSKFISSDFDSGIVKITNTAQKEIIIDINKYEPNYKEFEYSGKIKPSDSGEGETTPEVNKPEPEKVQSVVFQNGMPLEVNDAATQKRLSRLLNLGLLNGYVMQNGNIYNPGQFVTYGQLASLMCGVMNIDKTIVKNQLSNVPDNHWAVGQLNKAVEYGYIKNTNLPDFADKKVSFIDAITSFVNLANYQNVAKQNGAGSIHYLNIAKDMGLLKGIDSKFNDTLTVDSMLKLLDNLLNVKVMLITSIDSENIDYKTDKNETFLSSILSFQKVEGIMTENAYTAIDKKVQTVGKGRVIIDGQELLLEDQKSEGYVGNNVVAYAKKNTTGDIFNIVHIEYADKNIVEEIVRQDIHDISVTNGNVSIKTEKETYRFNENTTIIYNNRLYSDAFTPDIFKFDTGNIKLVDSNNDGTYEIAFIYSYKNYIVDTINKNQNTIITKGSGIKLDFDQNARDVVVKLNGETVEFQDIEAGNVISVAESFDLGLCFIMLSDKAANGCVDSISEDEVVIDGKNYIISPQFRPFTQKANEDLKVGIVADFYLDFSGEIMAFLKLNDNGVHYGFVIDVESISDSAVAKQAKLKLFSLYDSSIVRPVIADKVTIDGYTKKSVSDAIDAVLTADKKEVKRQIIKYKLNSDGEIVMIDTEKQNVIPDPNEIKVTLKQSLNWLRYEKTFGDVFAVDIDTKVIKVSDLKDAKDSDFATGSQNFQNIAYTVQAVDKSDVGIAKLVLLYPAGTDIFSDECMIVDSIISGVDSDGNVVSIIKGLQNSKSISLLTTEAISKEMKAREIKRGDVISVAIDNSGAIKNFKVRYQKKADGTEVLDSLTKSFTVIDKESGYVSTELRKMYYIGTRNVYRVDNNKVYVSSFDEIPKGAKVIVVDKASKVGTPSNYIYFE